MGKIKVMKIYPTQDGKPEQIVPKRQNAKPGFKEILINAIRRKADD